MSVILLTGEGDPHVVGYLGTLIRPPTHMGTPLALPPDLFKLVHHVAHTSIDKLKGLLVTDREGR